MEKLDLRNLSLDEVKEYLESIGEKSFRGKQIFKWIHRGVEDIDEMTDLSKPLREKLKNDVYICNMDIVGVKESKEDGTRKYLMRLLDSNIIECVFMKYKHGNSICISTQAGCRMGCTFCASTIGGKNRDLTAGEMLGQILKVEKDTGESISNIVLMGTGEPFDNYDNVLKFLRLVNSKDGINIGMRHITISTCGLVPEIKRFADENIQVNLAISLHSPNNKLRCDIMPIARKYNLDELMDACKYYVDKTNRRITFEYSLIDGVNDLKENALELCSLLKGILCHVNLIPINVVKERDYKKSRKERVASFKEILESRGINATVRRELGSDIDAACGQLRRQYIEKLDVLIETADKHEDVTLDIETLPQSLKILAESMKYTGAELQSAVAKAVRDERLKTELITNVSHDLKTPLTSIVNYVDLLGKEQLDNPRATEYVAVLRRQAQRLKKLTEDLVEASKASSGTMAVNRVPMELGELLSQCNAEYAERLAAANLELVTDCPAGLQVLADGRLLWRVFDNLLGNACKYSQPGTRVYITVEAAQEQVLVQVKNISREVLNVTPEALMERFVRGDSSRSAEGSGLGLSIAKSLMELNEGKLELAIDGDLFKALLTLEKPEPFSK